MVLKYIGLVGIFLCVFVLIYSCKDSKNISTDKSSKEDQKTRKQESEITDIPLTTNEKKGKWTPEYDSYINSRYGYSVMYPLNLEKNDESQNGDGRIFSSSDGFVMTVYGSNDISIFNKNIDDLYKEELNNHRDITYKAKKINWFVVSGYDGEYIFYIKKYVGTGSTNTLNLKYPSNLRDKYYDVITVISKSFKEGNINSSN